MDTTESVMSLLRIVTAGSVDDGKSTLIGRLLYDSQTVMQDQLAAVENISHQRGDDYIDLSLVTDGLRAEREQGITIDVAYRYFSTPRRKFIIADTPGHIQYTRNMVTGASTAQLAIVLVDARHGIQEQSRRHAFLASLLGINYIVLAVNKMDLIDWDYQRFQEIYDEFHAFTDSLGVEHLNAIPMSALLGDNVVDPSQNTPWYSGPPLLSYLETVQVDDIDDYTGARLPVQYVIRPQSLVHQDYRSYAGTISGGVFRVGDAIIALPSGKKTYIKTINSPTGSVDEAFPPMAVSVNLADDIDLSRGDMIAPVDNQPTVTDRFSATICWMDDNLQLHPGGRYLLKHTTRAAWVTVTSLDYRLDVNTLHHDRKVSSLSLNDLGGITLQSQVPLMVDPYRSNRATGAFILIDPTSNSTVAGGMITQIHQRDTSTVDSTLSSEQSLGCTVWLVGHDLQQLSTVATGVRTLMEQRGRDVCLLDATQLRRGISSDLGEGSEDQRENLRRLAYIAQLFAEAGKTVLALATPLSTAACQDARRIHHDRGSGFFSVICEAETHEETSPRESKEDSYDLHIPVWYDREESAHQVITLVDRRR